MGVGYAFTSLGLLLSGDCSTGASIPHLSLEVDAKPFAHSLRSLNTSLVPIASILELNQVQSLQCSIQSKGHTGVPVRC